MQSNHYDMILFENYLDARNHKIDLLLIAKMLKYAGKNVAILDIYHQDNMDEIEGIPVIHHHVPFNDILYDKRRKNPFRRLVERLMYFKIQYDYMSAVIDEVKDMADEFYCGSYHLKMASTWFELDKPCYYWGLRSNWMLFSLSKIKGDKFTAVRLVRLRQKFFKNKKQKLFVSNEIIKKEFEDLGLSPERMIIRPERVINDIGNRYEECLNEKTTFLSIGRLRKEKRIDYVIQEYKKLKEDDTQLFLIGRTRGKYENKIKACLTDATNIKRENEYLEYNDFISYYRQSHFLVLADIQIKGTVTNGTMSEALINYRPVIAPNYSPYKELIEEYQVGILYDPNMPGALSNAMKQAKQLGTAYFYDNIEQYLKTIMFDTVSKKLAQDIDNKS